MLSSPRPILLANARVVDPGSDLDAPRDVLIADGVIRDVQRGIRASGVPQGTEVVDCRGRVVAQDSWTCGLSSASRGPTSRDARIRQSRCRRRRGDHNCLPARDHSSHR